MSEHIQVELADGRLRIRMDRPKRRNAILPQFGLRAFQAPAGADITAAVRATAIDRAGRAAPAAT